MEIPTKISGVAPSITVLLSDDHDGKLKNFRCTMCGKIVFSYNNKQVRMILASGDPETDSALKLIECAGTMPLYTPADLYGVLHGLIEVVYTTDDVDKIRSALQDAAVVHEEMRTVRCNARYWVT